MDNLSPRPAPRSRKRKTTSPGSGSSEDILKDRRERNRTSQQEFRKRRQAAEASRRQRVQRLESVVEDMSVLFIDLFDQILRDEQVVKHCPQLLGMFQSSARRLKTLVEPVTDAEDGDVGSTGEPLGFKILEATAGYRHAEERAKGGRAMPDPRSTLNKDNQDKPSNPTTAVTRPLGRERDIAPSLMMTGLGQSVFPRVTPPPANTIIDTFSLQLLETTLSQACLVLDGYLPVPPEEVQRIFGTALQFQTQEQVLDHMRWLLASDLGQKQAAARMPWGAMFEGHLDTPQHAMQSLGPGLGAISPVPASDQANAAYSPPGFLTAVDIQERLRELGARQSGPDTLELRISGETGSGTSPADPGPEIERSSPPSTAGLGGALSSLTLHVNVSLLLVNLVQSATCFIAGPAYTQIGFSKAVERSVVLLDDSDFSALSSNP
ncbi:Putative basic-leucine zipper domain-containing protein [Colletotrichum destructivum]|uniref:Basic-leucine zipper domain-containing protein n=1 Tax=Colletotrichum destructivum TaxID=34406 RepID=A0AAX4I5Q7_9PEZI|nr:Putative basic-leucine zipper domain-containing protein [Colletotrichum destructivum]